MNPEPNVQAQADVIDQPSVNTLMLADRAEVSQGKLYIMGGSIDAFFVQQVPGQIQFGVAIIVEVPWNATNMQHHLTVHFEDSDGTSIARLDTPIRVGRPPWLDAGMAQRVPIGVPQITLPIQRVGTYVARSVLNERQGLRVPFNVRVGQIGMPIIAPQ